MLLSTRKYFGEDVSNLMPGRNVIRSNMLGRHLISDEVTIYVNVLDTFMIHGISSNGKGSTIITEEGSSATVINTQIFE